MSLLTHNGRTNLAHAHAMSPTLAVQFEASRYFFSVIVVGTCLKGTGQQVCIAQCTSYLQFLAYSHVILCARNLQFDQVSAWATLNGSQFYNLSEVDAQPFFQQFSNFFLL